MFFFFQAEDGIRDSSVTGVQTCALPISSLWSVACIIERVQVACIAEGRGAQPYADACFVHHMEHACKTPPGLAHQIADCSSIAVRPISHTFTEIQQTVCRTAISHFVVEA